MHSPGRPAQYAGHWPGQSHLPRLDDAVSFFTQCQFWPSGIFIPCVCLCVSVNHKLVHTIFWHVTLMSQWLATIRQATTSSLRRRREVIRLGDWKSDWRSQCCHSRLFSQSKHNSNSRNLYVHKQEYNIFFRLPLPGGVLGQVSDRDAPYRLSTRNATRVKKGGSKPYILPNFDEK